MLAPAITALFLLASSVDASASRQIAAPCESVAERVFWYLTDHELNVYRKAEEGVIVIDLVNRRDPITYARVVALTPSGKRLALNRFSIQKYTLPRHLSPFKAYDFQFEGQLRLAKVTEKSCSATLRFDITAYEWVWALAVIDDGYSSKFISNGTLERLYLDAIGDLFTSSKP